MEAAALFALSKTLIASAFSSSEVALSSSAREAIFSDSFITISP